jgi:ankyrin repeat protein
MLQIFFFGLLCSTSLCAGKDSLVQIQNNRQEALYAAVAVLAQYPSLEALLADIKDKDALVRRMIDTGRTVLHYAAMNARYDIISGCEVSFEALNIQDAYGKTPLMYAIEREHYYVASLLILPQVNLDLQDILGRTVLHYAVEKNNKGLYKCLKAAGARVDIIDKSGRLPVLKNEKKCMTSCSPIRSVESMRNGE